MAWSGFFIRFDVYFCDKMFPASGRFNTVVVFCGVALSRLAMLVIKGKITVYTSK